MARQRGFTLIELLIVILVVAVLAAISVSSYTEQIRKSRRTEAYNYVAQMQLNLERWRAENPCYAPSGNAGCSPTSYTQSVTTYTDVVPTPTGSYYTIALAYSTSQPRYTITATVISTSAQKNDRCGVLCVYSPGATATATCGTTKPLWATATCN